MRKQPVEAILKYSFSSDATLQIYSFMMKITKFKIVACYGYIRQLRKSSIRDMNLWLSKVHQLAVFFPRYGSRNTRVSHRQRYVHNLSQSPKTRLMVVYKDSKMLRLSSTSKLMLKMLAFIHFMRIERVSSQFGLPTVSSSQILLSKASSFGTLPAVLVRGNSPKTLFPKGWNSAFSAHCSQKSYFFNYASNLGMGLNEVNCAMMMVSCYRRMIVLLLLS